MTASDIGHAVELYESGFSLVTVGATLNINAGTVLDRLRSQGIRTRPVGTN
jgi:hypothetical protein